MRQTAADVLSDLSQASSPYLLREELLACGSAEPKLRALEALEELDGPRNVRACVTILRIWTRVADDEQDEATSPFQGDSVDGEGPEAGAP